MSGVLTVVGSVLLWVAGTIVFDTVHWVLHLLLRSRSRVLRLLAWPHAVHHRFLDAELSIRPEYQAQNLWCHLVPEYLTQLAWSAAMLPWLPHGMVVGCAAWQTAVFLLTLRYRGLDPNHRPIEILDAYRPSVWCPPAYHALHHRYPDAYWSAYTKVVDWIVGGGTCLTGRRFALVDAGTPFGRALRGGLERAGVRDIQTVRALDSAALAATDVLVLCDAGAPEAAWVESFIRATRARQVPPEAWVVHSRPEDGLARHYHGDVRVIYRTLILPEAEGLDPARAARLALFLIRRGAHYVPTRLGSAAFGGYVRFRRAGPRPPGGLSAGRNRAQHLVA
jgi:monoglucosyldiacylglycerol epimerase